MAMLKEGGSSSKSKKQDGKNPFMCEDEEEKDKSTERVSLGLTNEGIGGASYLRYEVLERKGQKILIPVRYSIRNCNLDPSFHTKEALQA